MLLHPGFQASDCSGLFRGPGGFDVHHLQPRSALEEPFQQPLATWHDSRLHFPWIALRFGNPGDGRSDLFVCFGMELLLRQTVTFKYDID